MESSFQLIEVPEDDDLGRREQQSTPLAVSPEYRDRFRRFAEHFEAEMAAVGDDALQQELDVLRTLAADADSTAVLGSAPMLGR